MVYYVYYSILLQYIMIYYSIHSLYYSIYLSEFCFVFRRNMGRSRKENPLTNAERKCKWQQKNWDKNLKQKREAYARKQQTISTEELKIQQEATCLRKAMSRQKLKNASQQKLQGMKLKDWNRKQKASTKWVEKHRKTLNFKFDFKKGNSQLNELEELRKQKIQEEVWLLESAEKEAAILTSIVSKQSPHSKKAIQHAVGSTTVLSPVKRALKATRKYCNASVQSSHKALLSVVATSQTNGSSHHDITSLLNMKWLSYVLAKNSISIDANIMQH